MNISKPVNILELGGGGGQCLSLRSMQDRRRGLEAFQTLLKEEKQEGDEEEKNEDDYDE